MAEKHPGGRTRKFKRVNVMSRKINKYFNSCWEYKIVIDMFGKSNWATDPDGNKILEQKHPYTVLGLCDYLDIDTHTLGEYEKLEEFSTTIKKARIKIEKYKQSCLFDKDRKNVAGIIFDLKHNHKWKDKIEVEHSNKVNIKVDLDDDFEVTTETSEE